MHRVALVLVALGFAPSALAESAPPICDRAWWEPEADVPTILTEVSSLPTLLLPARVRLDRDDQASLLATEAVTVEVRDAQGGPVAGQVELTPRDNVLYRLDGLMRWRPESPLVAGEQYTLALTVADAPEAWEPFGCPRRPGFSSAMTFTVAAAPVAAPSVNLSVEVREGWSTAVKHGFCDAMEFEARCDEPAHICCTLTRAPEWRVTSRLEIVGVLPPPLYTVVRFEAEWPRDNRVMVTRHPVQAEEPIEAFLMGSVEDTLPVGALCVTATVSDLMSGEVLASTRICPDAEAIIHETEPAPLRVCDPNECASFGPEPTEPGPESAELTSEPGPEPSDESDAAEAVADPGWDHSSSGCGVGSGGWFALVLFALFRGRVRRTPVMER